MKFRILVLITAAIAFSSCGENEPLQEEKAPVEVAEQPKIAEPAPEKEKAEEVKKTEPVEEKKPEINREEIENLTLEEGLAKVDKIILDLYHLAAKRMKEKLSEQERKTFRDKTIIVMEILDTLRKKYPESEKVEKRYEDLFPLVEICRTAPKIPETDKPKGEK